MLGHLLLAAAFAAVVSCTPLDDYVSKEDPNYKWEDTGATVKTLLGGTAHVLNVTSQKWLDESRAVGPNGALWTHQVLVVVPKNVRIRNKAFIYATGGCNENPSVPKSTDEDLLVVDTVAAFTGAIGVALFQIPNCHIVYPSDPSKKRRSEDAMIAWAWKQYLATQDYEWLPRLPMTKAVMRAMNATQDFVRPLGFDINGWTVAGASKRGWTTWTVGSVKCDNCPKVDAIAPLVPIVPDIVKEMHHQYRAYGGWTFAFTDYYDVNLTAHVDDPIFAAGMKVVDPAFYGDRLKNIPKSVVLSSNDEFMMMEWSNIWWNALPGETHLTIANNAEHSLVTGLPEVIETLSNFVHSVMLGGSRPKWDFTVNTTSGIIEVRIPDSQPHGKVVLRHAKTISTIRRDFRWVRKATEETGNCTFPEIPLKKPVFGGNCMQPIIWEGETLHPVSPGVYRASVPLPEKGWTGMYVEVYFPSDTGYHSEYQYTTPGMVWPSTFPFPDCSGAACRGSLV